MCVCVCVCVCVVYVCVCVCVRVLHFACFVYFFVNACMIHDSFSSGVIICFTILDFQILVSGIQLTLSLMMSMLLFLYRAYVFVITKHVFLYGLVDPLSYFSFQPVLHD